MGNYLHTLKLEALYTLYTILFTKLMFYKVVVEWIFITLFQDVEFVEIHNFVFTKVSKICEIHQNFSCKYMN